MFEKYSKAIGAAVGGGAGAAIVLPSLPENSPWYATVAMAAVLILGPAIATYLAPKNKA